MATAALLIALIGSSITVAQNGVVLWASIKAVGKAPVVAVKAVNKHTTYPLYCHVLKPVGKAVRK